MDAIACERQFLDHLAPVWRLLPPQHRGRLLTDESLVDHARALGVEAEAIDAAALRRSSLPPTARPGDGPAAFVVSIGDTKVARRLGYRRFAFMEHGAGQAYIGDRDRVAQRHPSYAGGVDRDDVGLFLVPNEYSADLWRRAYPAARVELVGCPKLEDLPVREPGPGPVVAISFHWPGFTCPEADTALGYYLKDLPALAAAFTVIGHAHPKADWPSRVERYFRRAGIPFVADFADVCRQADVYACDNSSTTFEFAATGRPVVVLNSPRYRRNVNHGLRFEPSPGCSIREGLHFCGAAHVGVQVDEPGELVAGVERAVLDEPSDRAARERALEAVYPIRTGAAQAAAAAITSWIEAKVDEVAA
jgi:hypothetical protein